jgi:hypothetical protein
MDVDMRDPAVFQVLWGGAGVFLAKLVCSQQTKSVIFATELSTIVNRSVRTLFQAKYHQAILVMAVVRSVHA